MKTVISLLIVATVLTIASCKNGTTDNTSSGNNTNDVSETTTPLNGGSTGPQNAGQPNSQQSADSNTQKGVGVGYDSATSGKTGGGSTGTTHAPKKRR